MNNGEPNLVLSLNKNRLSDIDPSKVSRIYNIERNYYIYNM